MVRKKKTKNKVRTWRDKPMEIIKPEKSENEYIVVMPGAQMQINSPLEYKEFVQSIKEQVESGKVELFPMEDNYFCMIVAEGQHFPFSVMTLQRFQRLNAEARFAQMGTQGRRQ